MRQSAPQRGPDAVYQQILEMPVAVVLMGMWLLGTSLIGACVLLLYSLVAPLMGA